MRAPFAPPRLSEPRKVDADAQAVETSSETDRPEARIFAFRGSDVLLPDQRMIHGGDRVLPDQRLLRNERAEIAHDRAHVAVRQLEPRPGKGVRELIRMLVEAPRDFFVSRVEPQGEVGGQHGGRVTLRRVERIRHRTGACAVLRRPLIRAGRALGQLPFVAEQVPEEVVAPLRRRRGPDDFEAAGDRVGALARAECVLPAEALMLDVRAFGRRTRHMRRIAGAVGLAEGVTAGNQRDGLLVVHRHALERLADVLGGGERIRLAVRPFRIDVDQTHLHRAERIFELAVAAVALVREPLAFGAPVDVLVGLPDIRAAAAETERLEAHRFEGDVARENHKVGPGDFPAVFLLDRPQQPARLVEARVVRPAVERREALLAVSGAAAAVTDAVRAGAVPRHPNEQTAVVAKVGRPPILRVRHQGMKVLDHGIQVEALEFLGVVERLAHRIGQGRVLVENLEVQLVRPPVTVHPPRVRALAFSCHISCSAFLVSMYARCDKLRATCLSFVHSACVHSPMVERQ